MTQQLVGDDDYATNMEELVTEIARALVDSPESVSVEAIAEGDGTVLRLRVAPGDIGKVIGKQGRTARSLRTILAAASMKLRHRFALDIVEQEGPPQN
jgi:predicted RNA-binding protein YlqC (UPF0109 family)